MPSALSRLFGGRRAAPEPVPLADDFDDPDMPIMTRQPSFSVAHPSAHHHGPDTAATIVGTGGGVLTSFVVYFACIEAEPLKLKVRGAMTVELAIEAILGLV